MRTCFEMLSPGVTSIHGHTHFPPKAKWKECSQARPSKVFLEVDPGYSWWNKVLLLGGRIYTQQVPIILRLSKLKPNVVLVGESINSSLRSQVACTCSACR